MGTIISSFYVQQSPLLATIQFFFLLALCYPIFNPNSFGILLQDKSKNLAALITSQKSFQHFCSSQCQLIFFQNITSSMCLVCQFQCSFIFLDLLCPFLCFYGCSYNYFIDKNVSFLNFVFLCCYLLKGIQLCSFLSFGIFAQHAS